MNESSDFLVSNGIIEPTGVCIWATLQRPSHRVYYGGVNGEEWEFKSKLILSFVNRHRIRAGTIAAAPPTLGSDRVLPLAAYPSLPVYTPSVCPDLPTWTWDGAWQYAHRS